jgi:serine/threonine protein kinase
MPIPAPEDFWSLVAASRLVAPDALAALRREYDSAAPPPAAGDDPTTAIAKWLVKRAAVSRWQARRLLSGDRGPFFVGDYRLMERLEGDGPGRLYRARHEPSGRSLCLMLLDRQLCQRPDVWQGIVRRAAIAHEVTDPVLSRTWALEQDPGAGNRFLLCEDVEGPSLADELSRLGPLEPAAACRVMLDVARGVAELHRRGAVHGGISLDAIRLEPPASGGVDAIGVTGGRNVRLLQIPLAGDPHAAASHAVGDATERIARLGRRASFVPPELVTPGGVPDRRSDVYSLGCVFHALLTGAAPCWKGDAQRTLSQASTSGPEPLGPPRVPVEVATLVAYMVARAPAGRYRDAAEAADAIAACLGLPPVSTTLPPQQPPIDVPVDAPVTVAAAPTGDAPTLLDVKAVKPTAPVDPRKAASRRRLVVAAAGGGILAMALTTALVVVLSRGGSAEKRGPHAGSPGLESGAAARAAAEKPTARPSANVEVPPEAPESAPDAGPRQTVVESSDLPWASPTAGRPPALTYMPPGAQLVLLARPADLLQTDEGELFVRALGPRVESGIDMLTTLCGTGLDGVEEILGGWQAGEPGPDQGDVLGGWVVRLAEPVDMATDRQARAGAWGATKEEKVGGETIHLGKTLSFWFPSAEQGRVLAIAPAVLLRQMVEAAGEAGDEADAGDRLPAGLSPDMESLIGMLDDTRHVTLLGSPHYLLYDGRPVLAGALARLVEPIHRFFGDDVKAAAVSLHFGDNFYLELDAVPSRDEPVKSLAQRLATGVDSWGDAAEDAVASANLHEYGRKLVMRLPTMIRALAANARSGPEGRAAVLNAYLPHHAAHNLVLASELALEQPAGRAGAAVGTAAAAPTAAAAATGGLARLQQKISLTFAKDTLEKSVQMVADEIGVPIEILGGDLQLEGITKNQSFSLEERDKTADAVLRAILAKSDPAGRLIFVVRKQGGEESLAVTTRAAAAKRGDTLPPGFETQPAAAPAAGKAAGKAGGTPAENPKDTQEGTQKQ